PPAGVSSTLRCLSVAKLRISTMSSDHDLAASALPARLEPSGPGNISGKIVRTLARHIASSRSLSPCGGGSGRVYPQGGASYPPPDRFAVGLPLKGGGISLSLFGSSTTKHPLAMSTSGTVVASNGNNSVSPPSGGRSSMMSPAPKL